MPSNIAVALLSPPKPRPKSTCMSENLTGLKWCRRRLEQVSGGKATGGAGRSFPFHFLEPAKLEVKSFLISEAARDMGDPEKP